MVGTVTHDVLINLSGPTIIVPPGTVHAGARDH